MKKAIAALVLTLTMTAVATAGRYFAIITKVDADKNTIVYSTTFGKDRVTDVTGTLAKDCVIKEGYYRLGKPATTKEGDVIANGLRHPVFQKATAEKPLQVNIYTADADDKDKGIKSGDVIKILVNPPRKK